MSALSAGDPAQMSLFISPLFFSKKMFNLSAGDFTASALPLEVYHHVQSFLRVPYFTGITISGAACCPCSVSYELPHAAQALVQVFIGGPVLRRHTAASIPVSPDVVVGFICLPFCFGNPSYLRPPGRGMIL